MKKQVATLAVPVGVLLVALSLAARHGLVFLPGWARISGFVLLLAVAATQLLGWQVERTNTRLVEAMIFSVADIGWAKVFLS